MKKGKIILVIFLLAIISINFVSAASHEKININQGVGNFVTDTVNGLKSIFKPILGGQTADDYIGVKMAFFFIIFLMVFIGLRNVDVLGNNRLALGTVSIIVAILSARYIPDVGFLQSLLLPYVAFFSGLLIVAVPIFLILITHSFIPGRFTRRLILGAAIASYAIYWWGGYFSNEVSSNASSWFRAIPLVVLVIAWWSDKTIHNSLQNRDLEEAVDEIRERAKQRWLEELRRAEANDDAKRVKKVKRKLRKYGINA